MLDSYIEIVIRRARLIVVLLLAITVALALFIPRLKIEPSVEALVAPTDPRAVEIARNFRSDFGDPDRILLLVVSADDVTAQEPLQYLHEITSRASEQSWVERTISLTTTPLPRRVARVDDGGFDALEADSDFAQNGGFDSLEEEPGFGSEASTEHDAPPEVVDALVTLTTEREELFPGGFQELGSSLSSSLVTTPIVEGSTVSESDVEELRGFLGQSNLLVGKLIARDRSVAVTAFVLREATAQTIEARIAEIESMLKSTPAPHGTTARLGGLPHVRTEIIRNLRADLGLLAPLTVLVSLLFLILGVRWRWGVALPIFVVVLSTLVVVGVMALANEPFNAVNNIIPNLITIIGINESIHIVARYMEELNHHDKLEAIRRTMRAMVVPCFLTAFTSAIGLLSLTVATSPVLQHFGLVSGVGVLLAYVVTISLVPAVLVLVRAPSRKAQTSEESTHSGRLEKLIVGLTRFVLRRPIWGIVFFAAGLISASILARRINVDHALLDQFSPQDEVFVTTKLLERALEGIRPLEVSLRVSDPAIFEDPAVLERIDRLAAFAKSDDEVLGAFSSNDILRQSLFLLSANPSALSAPFTSRSEIAALRTIARQGDDISALAPWLSDDGKHFRLQLKLRDNGAQATLRFIRNLERKAASELNGYPISLGFTGDGYDGSVGMERVVDDLTGSLGLAAMMIAGILTLLFRSLRLGVLTIPPNVVPLIGTLAYMVVVGIPLNAATAIVFSVSLGLGVDGGIHVLARYQEEKERTPYEAVAITRAMRGTARAILISSITLMAGFAVLFFSNFLPVRRFGELIAVTVLTTIPALLILQPLVLRLWPSRFDIRIRPKDERK